MKHATNAPKLPARRTRAVPAPAALRTGMAKAEGEKTLAEKALRQLRDDILNGRLAPDARLRINQLQQRYGLGLSPLREALLRLSTEGLVLAQGQRGFVVAPVSLADLQDQTLARKTLDTAALTQAIAHGDADWESQVIAANHLLARTPLPLDASDVETVLASTGQVAFLTLEDLSAIAADATDVPWELLSQARPDDPFGHTFFRELREALVEALEGLPERLKLVMSLYYYNELNFKEIGRVLDLTESRISQLHTQAVQTLRKRLRKAV